MLFWACGVKIGVLMVQRKCKLTKQNKKTGQRAKKTLPYSLHFDLIIWLPEGKFLVIFDILASAQLLLRGSKSTLSFSYFQVEKKISFATKMAKIGTQGKTSFFTNLSTDSTTLVSSMQFQTSMGGCASDTTTLKEPAIDGGIHTPCQLTGSISLKELRVNSTATTNRTRRMASTTTSILDRN